MIAVPAWKSWLPYFFGKVANGPSKILLFLLLTAWFLVCPAGAHALAKITFSWRANPPGDYVLGYRLYYGSSSRYSPAGTLKPDFSYDYYIDLYDSERCATGEYGTNCTKLGAKEMGCENLFSETPTCTVYNLPGKNYFFAMTAYNAVTESGYTHELNTSGKKKPTLQHITALLLRSRSADHRPAHP